MLRSRASRTPTNDISRSSIIAAPSIRPSCKSATSSTACDMEPLTTPLLQDDSSIEQSSHVYHVEKRRWAVLLAFSFANLSNAVLWVTFAPIASLTESFYGISDTKVDNFSISYLVAYIPGSMLALVVYSVRDDGLRRGIVLASLLSAVGATIRNFASPSYGTMLFGQYICATAQPFLTNVPPKLATAWFPATERDVATVLCSMANPVGIAIGSTLPALLVSEQDGNIVGMNTLLMVEAIIAATGAIVAAALVKSRPTNPPSAAAEMQANSDSGDEPLVRILASNVMLCMRNRHFLVLLASFGIGLGLFNAITTLTEQLIAPFCYTDDDASLFTGLLLGFGLLSAGIVGAYLDKTHRYRFMLKLLFTLATATLLLYSAVLRPDSTAGLAIVFSILGATMLPILPTALEAAVECTYPVSEEYSTGLLMSAGMVTGIGFIRVLQRLSDAQPSCDDNDGHYYLPWTSIVLLLSGTIATVIVLQFRGPLLRLQDEQGGDDHGDEVVNHDGSVQEESSLQVSFLDELQ